MACRGKYNIALESPFVEDEIVGMLTMENSFLACSAPTKRKFGKSHHLIDPYQGKSADEVVSVFLICPMFTEDAGMLTDGFATAYSVMSFAKASEKLQKNPLLEGLILNQVRTFFITENTNIELFS